jgi:hypothetical protein
MRNTDRLTCFLIESSSSSFWVKLILISTTMLLRAGVEEETWLSVSVLKLIDVGNMWLLDVALLLAEDG